MRNDGGQKQKGGVYRPGRTNGFIPNSFRTISGYLKIVSSGASTVARSAASVASSFVEREDEANHDQVIWAGFDTLEFELAVTRQALLLGYRSGFQVWDVEEADNVRDLVSQNCGSVSLMQVLPKPLASKRSEDKFVDSRPLLVVCTDGNLSAANNLQDEPAKPSNGTIPNCYDPANGSFMPTVVSFYSLKSQSFVYNIKLRSTIYAVRSCPRVIAISLAAQIHCINASTLEKDYTVLTNPIVPGCSGFGGIGYGPLAVGPRWLAYSGSPVDVSNSGRVNPQHLIPSASFSGFSSNGSLVAHYAKESSKQIAAGIITLGDMGYKKLSRYCSELLPDSNNVHFGSPGWKVNGTVNGHMTDEENVGMVIVRDIVSKVVIAQFRAHKSPISALCFDPTGTLLVTASVQGHNINVFKIMPVFSGSSSIPNPASSYVHLYRLQRGFTNAVIQDISFSYNSNWIMISSSRGTSHLFAINPMGGMVDPFAADASLTTKNSGLAAMTSTPVRWPPVSGSHMPKQQGLCTAGSAVTLSAISRIRNGNSSWKGAVNGAAASATGRINTISGAIASTFHNSKGNAFHLDYSSLKSINHLLVFSPSGSMIQYKLQISTFQNSNTGLNTAFESGQESDARLLVEAIRKWNIGKKQNKREHEDNADVYSENGSLDNRVYPEEIKKANTIFQEASCTIRKEKVSPEEKHHLYIAEAELQMHPARIPLWVKPEIYFQSMVLDGVNMHHVDVSGGETEIEQVPMHTVEVRLKDLIPVFDHLQASRSQKTSNINGQLLHPRFGLSENGNLSCRSSSGSLETMSDCGAGVAKLDNGLETMSDCGAGVAKLDNGLETMSDCGAGVVKLDNGLETMSDCGAGVAKLNNGLETGWDGLHMPMETNGLVNNNDSSVAKNQLETVNNIESSKMEAQLKHVNSNIEGLKMENHFEDNSDEVD